MGIGATSLSLFFILFLLPLALPPTIIAVVRNHPHKAPIILVNVFGGLFYGLGWVVALVWCFITPNENNREKESNAEALEKLHSLLEKGAITKEEYEVQKQRVLQPQPHDDERQHRPAEQ
ncbi:MAG: superinfection immunity protein [Abyssibacter sp.]|uniref:superinfection immunity protein n=1 Tax=Abyssibacter sp. TaxID=2320200 RepID=UPI0032194922